MIERARFLVSSESVPGDWYLVDLLEYHRNGFCGCMHFGITIQPVWEEGGVPERKTCKHIRCARESLAREGLAAAGIKRATPEEREFVVKKALFRLQRMELNAEKRNSASSQPMNQYHESHSY